MKKFFCFFVFFLFVLSSTSYALDVDLTGATVEIKDAKSLTVHNVTVTGVAGKYWADLTWDPVKMVLVPVAYGQEAAPIGHTYSFVYAESYAGDIYDTYQFTLTTDTVNRLIYITWQQLTDDHYLCPVGQGCITQGYYNFTLIENGGNDNTSAKIVFNPPFDGCTYLETGQTAIATISEIPSWFDFTKSFTMYFGFYPLQIDIIIFEPDGTYHK